MPLQRKPKVRVELGASQVEGMPETRRGPRYQVRLRDEVAARVRRRYAFPEDVVSASSASVSMPSASRQTRVMSFGPLRSA